MEKNFLIVIVLTINFFTLMVVCQTTKITSAIWYNMVVYNKPLQLDWIKWEFSIWIKIVVHNYHILLNIVAVDNHHEWRKSTLLLCFLHWVLQHLQFHSKSQCDSSGSRQVPLFTLIKGHCFWQGSLLSLVAFLLFLSCNCFLKSLWFSKASSLIGT